MTWKTVWLHVAEVLDAVRLFPRLLICGYAMFVYRVVMKILDWFCAQPLTQSTTIVAIVISTLAGIVTGFAPWIFKIYIAGGRDWKDHPAEPAI